MSSMRTLRPTSSQDWSVHGGSTICGLCRSRAQSHLPLIRGEKPAIIHGLAIFTNREPVMLKPIIWTKIQEYSCFYFMHIVEVYKSRVVVASVVCFSFGRGQPRSTAKFRNSRYAAVLISLICCILGTFFSYTWPLR